MRKNTGSRWGVATRLLLKMNGCQMVMLGNLSENKNMRVAVDNVLQNENKIGCNVNQLGMNWRGHTEVMRSIVRKFTRWRRLNADSAKSEIVLRMTRWRDTVIIGA